MRMKCRTCGRPFKEGDMVIPISRYVENDKRGDFVSQSSEYAHADHLVAA